MSRKRPQPKPIEPGVRSRRFLWGLAAVSAAGLVLRLGVGAELSACAAVANPSPATDMATYRNLALGILSGQIPEFFYYQPLYYGVFLPLVYGLLGPGPWGLIAVQALLGAASAWFAGLVAARLAGRRAGLAAALCLALARLHIFYTPFALLEVLVGFILILWVWLVTHAYSRNRWRDWGWAAAAGAAGVLGRGNFLLLLPGLLGLLTWRNRRSPARLCLWLGSVLLLVWLPQLPFSLRNWHHYGRWTGPSSAQDAVLALGNTPESPPGGLVYPPTYHQWMKKADLPADQRLPVSRQVLGWARTEPLAWAELKCRMLLLFWHAAEVPNNVGLAWEGRDSLILAMPILLPDFGVIAVLALSAMLILLRSGRGGSGRALFLHFVVLVFCGATLLFYILDRFRLPLVPVLSVYAGVAVDHVLRLWRARRRGQAVGRQALFCVGAGGLAGFIVWFGFPVYQSNLGIAAVRWARPHGVVVSGESETTVYDHGPFAFGGWTMAPVPDGVGMRLRKRFALPSTVGSDLGGAAVVRVPLVGIDGGQVRLSAVAPDLAPVALAPRVAELARRDGVQWQEVPLSVAPRDGVVEVEIVPVNGRFSVVFDRYRDYGRTQIVKPTGETEAAGAEACLELVLVKP